MDNSTTPRSIEEVHEIISKLIRRQAKLEEDTMYLLTHIQQTYEGPHRQFWGASELMESRRRELDTIADQLRVLYWVVGKYEHFPVV